MKNAQQIPILLLFFNRPRHAEAVLDRVRLVRPERLYIHCDGPRSNVAGEAEKVMAVRKLIESIDWPCAVTTLFREQNMGLRNGVSNALDWFFGQEEMGIVLEDDCLPDLSFFPFCAELLQRYANDAKVMHIGGSNVAHKKTEAWIESYFFSKTALVWGWASWRRAWAKMTLTLDGLDEFENKKEIRGYSENPMIQAYLLDKFETTRQQRNQSWAYAWSYSVLKNDGLAIVPTKNLVQNTGIGAEEATNTGKRNAKTEIKAVPLAFPLLHPAAIARNAAMDQTLFYAYQKAGFQLFLWYFLKKLGLR